MPAFESAVVTAARVELERRGAYVLNFHGSARRIGVPDLIACYRGRFIGIECKQRSRKPTARQRAEAQRIRHRGGIVLTIDDIEQLRKALDELDTKLAA